MKNERLKVLLYNALVIFADDEYETYDGFRYYNDYYIKTPKAVN